MINITHKLRDVFVTLMNVRNDLAAYARMDPGLTLQELSTELSFAQRLLTVS